MSDLHFPAPGADWAPAPGDGWDRGRLDAAVATIGALNSTSVVVLEHGRLLAEGHFTEAGADHREEVASVQKSVVALLVGIAHDRGLVDIDAPVGEYVGAGWSKATPEQEAAITVHHLLSMTSGLDQWFEFQAPAGDVWFYNTPGFMMLKHVVAAAADAPFADLTADWLSTPTGMAASTWYERQPFTVPEGTPERFLTMLRSQGFADDPDGRLAHRMPDGSLATGWLTSASDLARLALLVQARGAWDGAQVVPETWVDRCTRPSQELNPAYGYLFWLNTGPGLDPAGNPFDRFQPGSPDDLVAARGAQGRSSDSSRSTGLVMVRCGGMTGDGRGETGGVCQQLWDEVLAARR